MNDETKKRLNKVAVRIAYVVDDGFTYLRKWWRNWGKSHLQVLAIGFSVVLCVTLLYKYGNDILDVVEQSGFTVEEKVVTDKIQVVRSGTTYFYLVSAGGEVMRVSMSDYLSSQKGDKRSGIWENM